MGKTAAEVEIDIQRRRNALDARVARLDQRVRDDIHSAQRWRTERIEGVKANLHDMESEATGKAKRVFTSEAGSDTTIAQHPAALLAASTVGGFILGAKSGKSDDPPAQGNNGPRSSNGARSSTNHGGGILTVFSETIRAVVAAQAGALVETALDAGTSGLKSAAKEVTGIGSGGDDAEPAPETQPEARPVRTRVAAFQRDQV